MHTCQLLMKKIRNPKLNTVTARERSDQARGSEATEGGQVWKGGVPPSTIGSFGIFKLEMVQSSAYFSQYSTQNHTCQLLRIKNQYVKYDGAKRRRPRARIARAGEGVGQGLFAFSTCKSTISLHSLKQIYLHYHARG